MDNRSGRLRRGALVSKLEQLGPGSVAMVGGPYGSGRATLVRQWLEGIDRQALWWSTARAIPGPVDAAVAGDPDVVVIRLHDGGAHDAESILACRRCWPASILVVVSPYGWPEGLRTGPLRPEVAVVAHDLGFTADDVRAWAGDLGVDLSAGDAADVVTATGGYAVVVDAVVRRAAAWGTYGPEALARGCDDAMAELSAASSGGVVPWELWEISLIAALGGELRFSVMESLWARVAQGAAALRSMRDGGLIADGAQGRLTLAPGIRDACRRRVGTDLAASRHWELVEPLVDRWSNAGALDDAIAVLETPLLEGERTALMARHWADLAELPAVHVRERMSGLAPDADPRLLVAAARAHLDITHAGHPGLVTGADRDAANALLARVRPDQRLDAAGHAMVTALDAVSLRVVGRHDDAHALHSRVLADLPHPGATRAAITLQAALSAMSAGALSMTGEHAASAARLAREAGQTQLGAMAAELEGLVHILGADPSSWWRRAYARSGDQASAWRQVSQLAQLVKAVRAVDVTALLEACADDTGAATLEDPVVIGLFAWCFQAMALTLLDRPQVALTHTQVMQTALADRELSGFEQRMLIVARAEALSASGDPTAALELLAEHYPEPDHRYDVELLRARAEIDSGAHAAALLRIQRTVAGHEGHLGRHTAWGNVLLAIAHRGVGSARASDRVLESALAAAARNGQRQPFARQGLDEFGRLIAQGQQLVLDPVTHEFLTELTSTRDMLRAVTAPVTLTTRERLLLERLVRTEGVRRLAGELHVSPNTVKSQLRTLYRKLEVSSRAEAIRVAQAMRLVPLT